MNIVLHDPVHALKYKTLDKSSRLNNIRKINLNPTIVTPVFVISQFHFQNFFDHLIYFVDYFLFTQI